VVHERSTPRLSEEREDVLAALADSEDQCADADELARQLDLSEVRVLHHLDEFARLGLVRQHENVHGQLHSLTAKGRRYVVEQDLDD
jgi:predicted ArsR family transcriptional regulator